MRSKYCCRVYCVLSGITVFAVFGFYNLGGTVHAQDGSPYLSNPLSYGSNLGSTFANGPQGAVSEDNDAGLFLSPEVALGDRRLKAYSSEKLESNKALVPGLAGIATHVLREQVTDTDTNKNYSLADAMADALWRKQVVDSLYRNRGSEDNLQ